METGIGSLFEIIADVPKAIPVIIVVIMLTEVISQAAKLTGRSVVIIALVLGTVLGGGAKLQMLESTLAIGETFVFTFSVLFDVLIFGLTSGVLAVGADQWIGKQFGSTPLTEVITGGPGGQIETLPAVKANPLDPTAMSHPSQQG